MTRLFEHALDAIAGRINFSTGLAQSGDFASTVEMFDRLLNAGEAAKQDEIVDYLQRVHRMPADAAQEVQRVYETLAYVRQPGRQPSWKDDILDQFRKKP